jgi:predicted nucleic acid-binding protein
MIKTSFKVVPDTNVLLASEKSTNLTSPNKEFFERWRDEEFELLYSENTLLEYIEKMREEGVSEKSIRKFIRAIFELGHEVYIMFYHLPHYPIDPDDIAFLLCAENGDATHLLSYDKHLQDLDCFYFFKVCKPLDFIFELRKELAKK